MYALIAQVVMELRAREGAFRSRIGRLIYRVGYGENPEETDLLKDFPLEADMFPVIRRTDT